MSASSPERTPLCWLAGPWPGRLAIASCPLGGTLLEANLQAWRNEGVDVLVSLLEWIESVSLEVVEEAELCQRLGLVYRSYPIHDHDVPASRESFKSFLGELEDTLKAGKSVVVHCLAGVGRSGLAAACLLLNAGLSPEQAMQRVSVARGWTVPETAEQKEWINQFARHYPAST